MAFNVNQHDNSSNNRMDLDKYGVWVKKAPCTIEEGSTLEDNSVVDIPSEVIPENSELAAEASPIDEFESMALEETSELPSFVEKEDDIPQETFIDTDFLDDFTNDISALMDDDKNIHEELPSEDTLMASQDDFAEPEQILVPEESMEISEESFEIPEEILEAAEFDSEITIVGEDTENDDFVPASHEDNLDMAETEPELPDDFSEEKLSFMDELISPTQDVDGTEENTIINEKNGDFQLEHDEEEIDIEDFFSDTDEINLEDFMDPTAQEKSDIQDEVPMDMELTFDDDFAVDTMANPANQMEETVSTESLDDFDKMFDNIVDEAEVQTEEVVPETPVEELEQEIQFDEVNDFDDLLDELSDSRNMENKVEEPRDFVMEVTLDDDKQEPAVDQLDDEAESMENISLAMDDTEKTDENRNSSLDRLQISDYTDSKRMSDDNFDIDKIISEVEDIGDIVETTSPAEAESIEEPTLDDIQAEELLDNTMEMPEEAMEFNQNEMEQPTGSRTEELISNIASEIALLRDEIANLKSEFEAFKGGQTISAGAVVEPEKQETSSGGFFADSTDDDTIALSGDELSNIFNTADFTEESVDAESQQVDGDSDNGLPAMDFDSETLEEPVIDDTYFDDQDIGELPNEIDIPTGIVSQQDEIFEEIELEEEAEEMEPQEIVPDVQDNTFDAVEEQIEEFGNLVQEDDTLEEIQSTPETIEEIESISDFDDEIDEENEFLAEIIEEVEPEEVLAEEITQEQEEEVAGTAEPVEEEITDEPTEVVFESNQWDAPAEDTMRLADIPVQEEVESETTSFNNDPLIIEETVDTVSVAEEELLEELEEIPVSDEHLAELETFQQETTAEEEGEEPESIAEIETVEDESTAEEEAPCEDVPPVEAALPTGKGIPDELRDNIKSVLLYMDQLLDSLPEEKIAEFARSEHFELYKKLFTELGLS